MQPSSHSFSLRTVRDKLHGMKQARRLYEPQLASRFNAIGIFSPNENRLSYILAELLNPLGSHGQGVTFLQGFIDRFREHLNIDHDWKGWPHATVKTETPTHAGRRIDITITHTGSTPSERWAIGIENKPWAGDEEKQVKDYLEYLEHHYPGRHRLIYLSGTGDPPSERSTGTLAHDHLVTIGYPELTDWINDCITACKAPRVRSFLDELNLYISQTFCGITDMTEHDMIVNEALQSPESIEAALHISAAMDSIKTRLLDKLWEDCDELAKKRNWEFTRPGFTLPDSKYDPESNRESRRLFG